MPQQSRRASAPVPKKRWTRNRGRSGSSRQSRCPSRGETFERSHRFELRYGRRTLLFRMYCRFSSGIPNSGTTKPSRAHRRSSREVAHMRRSQFSSALSAHLGRRDPSLVLPKSASLILQASSSHTMESVAATKVRIGTLFTVRLGRGSVRLLGYIDRAKGLDCM